MLYKKKVLLTVTSICWTARSCHLQATLLLLKVGYNPLTFCALIFVDNSRGHAECCH